MSPIPQTSRERGHAWPRPPERGDTRGRGSDTPRPHARRDTRVAALTCAAVQREVRRGGPRRHLHRAPRPPPPIRARCGTVPPEPRSRHRRRQVGRSVGSWERAVAPPRAAHAARPPLHPGGRPAPASALSALQRAAPARCLLCSRGPG